MFKLYTKANRLMACNEFNVSPETIICNDVILPRDFDIDSGTNPHNVRLWLIGHCHGPVCAIWADCEQDALDNACDANMLECMLVPAEDLEGYDYENNFDCYTGLGNASELHDLSDCWIAEVELLPARDIQLIVKLARAAEGCHDTLDF